MASVRAFWMVSAIRVGAVAVSLELSAGFFGLWQAHVPAVPLASLPIGDSLPTALGAVDVGFAALAAAGCCAASWPLLLAGVLIQLVLCCADAARAMVAWGPGWALPEATGLQAPMIKAVGRADRPALTTLSRPFLPRFPPFFRRSFALSGFLAPRRRKWAKNGAKWAKNGQDRRLVSSALAALPTAQPMILVALLSMLHNPLARRLVARWRPGPREPQVAL